MTSNARDIQHSINNEMFSQFSTARSFYLGREIYEKIMPNSADRR